MEGQARELHEEQKRTREEGNDMGVGKSVEGGDAGS